ncbi:MAG: hypothetical protein RID09_02860, partial [Coleofasciculus sp. G1-WW12-02]|uniref:hypothetical protein n=1 Tax=Coleofasciculus sp. G1-WW12-02 TaxID=3068483 RepID=UPI0032F69BB4
PTQLVLSVPEQKGQAFASAKLLYSTHSQNEAKPSPFIGFPRPLNPYTKTAIGSSNLFPDSPSRQGSSTGTLFPPARK